MTILAGPAYGMPYKRLGLRTGPNVVTEALGGAAPREFADAGTAHLQIHESQSTRQVTFHLQGCSVKLSAPRPPVTGDAANGAATSDSDETEQAQGRVEITRSGSRLDAQDLALLARVMQLSNDTSLKPPAVRCLPAPLLCCLNTWMQTAL